MKYFTLLFAFLVIACQSPTGSGQPPPLHTFPETTQVSSIWRIDSMSLQKDSAITCRVYGEAGSQLVFTFVIPDTLVGYHQGTDVGVFTKQSSFLVITTPNGITSGMDSSFSASGYIDILSVSPFHAQFDFMIRDSRNRLLTEYWGTLKSKQN